MDRRFCILISLFTPMLVQVPSTAQEAETRAAEAPDQAAVQRCRLAGKVIGRADSHREGSVSWSTDWAQPGGAVPLGEEGTFAFQDLPPGRYRLCYRGENVLPTYYVVVLSPGDNAFDIKLPPCRLAGRIFDATYEKPKKRWPLELPPSGNIHVIPRGSTVSSGNRVAFVHADPAGRFQVDHLPPGDYVVRWEGHPGFVARPTVRHGEEEVSVELRPPEGIGSVIGKIEPGKNGDAEFAVHAFPKCQHGYDTTIWNTCYVKASPYEYRIADLPAGTYGIFVTPSGLEHEVPRVFVVDVEVQPGRETTCDLAIPPGRLVSVDYDFSEGKSSMFRWDLVYPNGGVLPDQAFVGSTAEGFYAGRSAFMLPMGEYEVIARFGDDNVEKFSFVLEPDLVTVRAHAPKNELSDWPKRE